MSQAFGVAWENLRQGCLELLNLCIIWVCFVLFFLISLTHLNVRFQLPAIIAVSYIVLYIIGETYMELENSHLLGFVRFSFWNPS